MLAETLELWRKGAEGCDTLGPRALGSRRAGWAGRRLGWKWKPGDGGLGPRMCVGTLVLGGAGGRSLVLNVCRLLRGAVDGEGRCGGDGRWKGEAEWQ